MLIFHGTPDRENVDALRAQVPDELDGEVAVGELVSVHEWQEGEGAENAAVLRHARGTGHVRLASGAVRHGALAETDTAFQVTTPATVGTIVTQVPKDPGDDWEAEQ